MGSAILSMSAWSFFAVLGLDAGSAKTMVVANNFNMFTSGVYLVATTNPLQNAYWHVILFNFVFVWPGAALGTFALSALPESWLELIVGLLIFLTVYF